MLKTVIFLLFVLCNVSFCSCTSNIDKYLDKCVLSRNHKAKPGPEGKAFLGHCQPWATHSCCTNDTSTKIAKDGILSLYNMLLDQCPQIKNMSDKCRSHFKKDTCFYECSPNLAPWIVKDTVSKVTRKERIAHVPLCSSQCDQWFEDCKFDYTCSGNWGDSSGWNWKKRGTPQMCKQPCKTFKEYYKGPKTFCEKIFNYSFKYGSDNTSECMSMWPTSWRDNLPVARKHAAERIANNPIGFAEHARSCWFQIALALSASVVFHLM